MLGAAAVVALIFAISSGGSADAEASEKSAAPTPAAGSSEPAPAKASTRPGASPDRPAPAIPAEVWTKADGFYSAAADLWNEGQRERRAGRTAEYQKALLASWDALQQLGDAIEPYTDWFEEADLEGWAMPADYDRLHSQLEVWDALRTKVRKLKPIERR